MSENRSIACYVYKSSRKEDHYVYLPQKLDIEDLDDTFPQAIIRLLGELRFVVEFQLSKDKKLAQADAEQVLADIEQQGFYLQMPKKDMRAEEDRLFS